LVKSELSRVDGMPQTTTIREEKIVELRQQTPLYRVVLLDDDDHTYDYVIEMLQKVLVFSVQQAYQHAVEVDTHGRTILIKCELGEAEFARDQVQNYGPDWRLDRSKGSMSAIVEPEESRI
jgi:ATP-dependent Clp protease adaptor protein ClpS